MSSSRLQLPCLAFHRRNHSTALYTVSAENLIVALNDGDTDEVLRNKTVCPTGRGLLLVRDPDTMDTFLLRPQDGDRIHLPPLVGIDDGELMHSHCLLSDEPSAPGCVLLLVEGVADNSMWYCHPGDDDDRWVKYEYDIGTMTLPHEYEGSKYMKITICSIAACRGKFYFNGTPEELGVLDFCPGPVFSSIAIDDSFDSDEEEGDDQGYEEEEEAGAGGPDPPESVFLVESGGELYKVNLLYATFSCDQIDQGFVQRMDFSARRWRHVGDLGGRTFLLSRSYFGVGASSCSAGGGLQQDCVYFLANPRRKEMQVFNVKEDTNELHSLDEAPPCNKAFWLLPSTS